MRPRITALRMRSTQSWITAQWLQAMRPWGASLRLQAALLAAVLLFMSVPQVEAMAMQGASKENLARNGDVKGRTASENSGELPVRYDLREEGKALTVYDQKNQSSCWAYAAISALEAAMKKQAFPAEAISSLEADHLIMKNAFGTTHDSGGDYTVSSSYFLAWQGPVGKETEPLCHIQEIRYPEEKNYTAIKQAVYTFGGVQTSLYMPERQEAIFKTCYQESTCGFYYDGDREVNHDIVIIGWDDGYSRNNFANKPASDGAFLCLNSWGEGFGDKGCFFVSYEDTKIGRYNALYSGIEPTDNYDAIYQADLGGWTGQLGYGSPSVWIANVYEAAADETMRAAGFYALKPNTSYRLWVFPVPEKEMTEQALENCLRDKTTSSSGTTASSGTTVVTGTVPEAGYYTIAFGEGLNIKKGERFAVAAEVYSPGTVQPAAIEYRGTGRSANVDTSDGEGYISADGVEWKRVEEQLDANICLKVYTKRSRDPQ